MGASTARSASDGIAMSDLPPLPAGFQMDAGTSMPPMPAGFVPEQPHKFGLGDTWPARLAKSIYGAVTLPGDVYKGDAAVPSSENNAENIDRVTNLAGVVSPTVPGSIAGTKLVPAPVPVAAETKAAAKSVFNDPAVKAIPIPPEDVGNLTSKITNDLTQQGFRPSTNSAPGTFEELARLSPPDGAKAVSVDDLRAARSAFSKYAGSVDALGKPTSEAAAATQAIRHVDNFLDTVAPEIRTANANYAATKAAEQLDYRQMQAAHRAAKTGSGSNIENTMRQEVDKIKNRGLTSQEQELRNQIVEGDTTRNALRRVGKLGFNDGLTMMLHAGAALPTGGLSTVVGAGATLARKYGEHLTRQQIEQLRQMILSRSPLAQSRAPMLMPAYNPSAAAIAGGQITIPQILGLPFGGVPIRANNQQ